MRQGQQNRRGRGRNNNNNNNNNNRKGGHHHNPLSRSFESNGPDVKIRGTPAHIAEKYMTLARDAHSSGDPVLAENYLQHAEHYSRIIMAYREQLNPPGEGAPVMNGNGQRMRMPGEMDDSGGEFGEDDGGDQMGDDGFPQQFQPPAQNQQPRHDNNRNDGNNNRQDRPFRRDRDQQQGRNRDRYNNDRQDRGDRNGMGDRDRPMEGRPPPPPPAPSQERPPEQGAEGGDQRRRDRLPPAHEQPEFLRRPVRRARTENGDPGKDDTSRE